MALSMYEASVPLFARGLDQLVHVLSKGFEHAKSQGIEPGKLVEARLAPDMLNLAGQVQRASDTAKGAIARLAGIEMPSYPDEEKTFDELIGRCAKTRDFVQGVDGQHFKGSGDREIVLKVRDRELRFSGQAYLLHYAIPNFYFHVTTAYDVLRNQGVPVGKRDYLGRF